MIQINPNDYDGHTQGPWLFCIGYDIETDTYTGPSPLKGGGDRVNGPVILSDYQFERGTAGHQADLKLIEDAPLLLEEVKRLREQGRKLVEAAERVRSDISDQDTGWYYQLGGHIERMNRLVSE
jgi:hypothetical protein